MVDWNKDVKLSDLLGRKPKDEEETIAPPSEGPASSEGEVRPEDEVSPMPAPTPAAPVAVSPAPPAPPAPAQVPPATSLLLTDEAEVVEDSVPWYKRELSFGRKSGPKKPKTEKPHEEKKPKAEKPHKEKKPKEKKLKEKKPKEPKGEEVPFYKRELSLGRKPKSRPKGKAQKGSQSAKRNKRVTGLKIGGSQLAAARIHNNGVPELVQMARQDLEPGVIVGGELRDPDALA